jgi:hypothetical protein
MSEAPLCSRWCTRICSAIVGVPHRPLLPSLPLPLPLQLKPARLVAGVGVGVTLASKVNLLVQS